MRFSSPILGFIGINTQSQLRGATANLPRIARPRCPRGKNLHEHGTWRGAPGWSSLALGNGSPSLSPAPLELELQDRRMREANTPRIETEQKMPGLHNTSPWPAASAYGFLASEKIERRLDLSSAFPLSEPQVGLSSLHSCQSPPLGSEVLVSQSISSA